MVKLMKLRAWKILLILCLLLCFPAVVWSDISLPGYQQLGDNSNLTVTYHQLTAYPFYFYLSSSVTLSSIEIKNVDGQENDSSLSFFIDGSGVGTGASGAHQAVVNVSLSAGLHSLYLHGSCYDNGSLVAACSDDEDLDEDDFSFDEIVLHTVDSSQTSRSIHFMKKYHLGDNNDNRDGYDPTDNKPYYPDIRDGSTQTFSFDLTVATTHLDIDFYRLRALDYVNKVYVDDVEIGVLEDGGDSVDLADDPYRLSLDGSWSTGSHELKIVSARKLFGRNRRDYDDFCWDEIIVTPRIDFPVNHYRIEHAGVGITCQRSEVTIRACADTDCTSEYSGEVEVVLTPATANPPTWIGGDSYTFVGSETVFLRQTLPGVVTLGIASSVPVSENGYKCFSAGVEGSCDIEFFESGFIFDVPDLTSCQPSPLVSIQAVRADDTGQVCIVDGGFANTEKSVNFWSTYANPATGTEQVFLNGTGIANSSPGSGISLNFDAEATATFTVNYPDAGQMQLNARYDGVDSEEAGLVMLGSDSFIARPVGLCVYSDDVNNDCASADGSCAAFKKVDENFNLKVKAVCWESSGDTDFCSGNLTTQNFQLSAILLGQNLVAPSSAGVSPGNIGVSSIDISAADNGEHVIDNQTVSEVGVYTFTATPPDYFGTPLPAATSTNIGRFTPDHFVTSVTENGVLEDGCTGFTYSGQPFTYRSPNFPEMVMTATGRAGNTTVNYRDDFVKLTDPATQINMPVVSSDSSHLGADGSTLLNLTWSPAATTLIQNNNGSLNFSLGDDQFTYTREVNALVAPFISDVQLPVNSVTDSDGIVATDLPRNFLPTGTEIRYGRMQLQNAYGPETLPLAIPVMTEYYNGASFVLNSLDSCTSYNSLHLVLSNFQGHLTAGDTTASGSGTLLSGIGSNLSLSAPGVGNDGSVDLVYDLDAAGLEWLKPEGNNPTAKVTFGIFKGNRHLIYMRESIW